MYITINNTNIKRALEIQVRKLRINLGGVDLHELGIMDSTHNINNNNITYLHTVYDTNNICSASVTFIK